MFQLRLRDVTEKSDPIIARRERNEPLHVGAHTGDQQIRLGNLVPGSDERRWILDRLKPANEEKVRSWMWAGGVVFVRRAFCFDKQRQINHGHFEAAL